MSEKVLVGACLIGQSGGPTAVINGSAQGVIQTALKADCITRVLGAAHGIKGVLEDKRGEWFEVDLLKCDFTVKALREGTCNLVSNGCLYLRELKYQRSCKKYRGHSDKCQPEYFQCLFDKSSF